MNNFLLKSYLKCKRKAWLDFKGDKKYKSWSAQNSIHNFVESKTFEEYTENNLFSGLKGCENGYMGVLGIKIHHNLKQDLEIREEALLDKERGVKYLEQELKNKGEATSIFNNPYALFNQQIIMDNGICNHSLSITDKTNR